MCFSMLVNTSKHESFIKKHNDLKYISKQNF